MTLLGIVDGDLEQFHNLVCPIEREAFSLSVSRDASVVERREAHREFRQRVERPPVYRHSWSDKI